MSNLHETRAQALRQLAGAHAEIAGHWSQSSREALNLAQSLQRDPNAFEHYATIAKSDGRTAELHRNLAEFAETAAIVTSRGR